MLSFNILQGGNDANNTGFSNKRFGGSRHDELAAVIKQTQADVIGVQEDTSSDRLLTALGDNWRRAGSIYSKYPLTPISVDRLPTVCRVHLPSGDSIVIVNTHWRPGPYGPYDIQKDIRQNGAPQNFDLWEQQILDGCDKNHGARGYQETVDTIQSYVAAGETVILTGDFNEPSHLDWTKRAAEQGLDRWVENPTHVPLRFAIAWRGSQMLEQAGMRDAYRTAFPDEVEKPGLTWTPTYPAGTPGRHPNADRVLDRIDMVYFTGANLRVNDAAVVGESAAFSEIVFPGEWPSDHRAVLVEFEIGAQP
ncbi:putative endonuclease/exonuclease/phosphatase family protein [Blastopirellula marina DSM 3645]|uniref:Putative endonuclease/exonuclease/phosphatase family protein n=1 Tax=Blastopirellula marina DSM 3645 TaxID=314230 RepID=A3ZR00_9BACT|nr:putative endonuclease/exonuclease/phosphatase family protein [Blastopirellula marina DSM 3645]